MILSLETSGRFCSVALGHQGTCLGSDISDEPMSHSRHLGPMIEKILSGNNCRAEDLDAVAVSMGPGSYTGLRIGVSTAKGIAWTSAKKLIGISTLQIMLQAALRSEAYRNLHAANKPRLLCPMIDARRMEVYAAFFTPDGQSIRKASADIINEQSYKELLGKYEVLFFGDGAAKCKEAITHPDAVFLSGIKASAADMIPLSEQAFRANRFEDIAYFEPFYLKDFIPTIPKNKILPG